MKKTNRAGYTIVELLIVMAVTSVTAVTAFTVVRGQQSRNEFSQSVRDFESKINDVANDVAKGYFPNNGNRPICSVSNAGINFVAPPGGSPGPQQGSSNDCVFAGKALEFNPSGDDTRIRVLTIAARRRTRDNKTITSLANLQNEDMRSMDGQEEDLRLQHGLRVKSVRYDSSNGNNAVVFLSGFANRPNAGASLTGAPETDLYWMASELTNPSQCTGGLATALRRPVCYVAPSTAVDDRGIIICVEHGTGGRTARFNLGQNGRQMTTTTTIDPPTTGPGAC